MVRPRLVQDNSMVQTLPVPPVRYRKDQPVTATTTHLDNAPTDTDDGNELIHTVCPCNPDRALCGTDVAGETLHDAMPQTPDDCVVCEHLANQPCQNCGE